MDDRIVWGGRSRVRGALEKQTQCGQEMRLRGAGTANVMMRPHAFVSSLLRLCVSPSTLARALALALLDR